MPLVSTLFWLTTFIGDQDEPDDLERWIDRNIDDGLFGDILSRGVLSSVGIDFSAKLDQSKIFSPFPFVEFKSGEAGFNEMAAGALTGPAGTTGANFYRAYEYYSKGDMMKGIEYSVPKGIRTALESYRLATEGYSLKNGDVVVDPRDMGSISLFLNGLGIPVGDVQKIKWTRGQQYVLENYYAKETSKITRKYIEAHKNRDRDTKRKLRKEWKELQKSKARVRSFFNNARGVLKNQPVTDLIKAPLRRVKREKKSRAKFGN